MSETALHMHMNLQSRTLVQNNARFDSLGAYEPECAMIHGGYV